MNRWTITTAIVCILVFPIAQPALTKTAGPPPEVGVVNRGIVELQTARAAGISIRIAEDLANVIDDGATRRVLPVVGKSSLETPPGLEPPGGIDGAILQTDVLDFARQQNLFPAIESWASYICKLYNEEFHLLAGPDIKTISDLSNRKVNIDLRGAGTAITAVRLFDLLKIPVTTSNDDQRTALEKLRKGEIAAAAFVAGKPAPIFRELSGNEGLHFLAIPL